MILHLSSKRFQFKIKTAKFSYLCLYKFYIQILFIYNINKTMYLREITHNIKGLKNIKVKDKVAKL